MVFKDLVIEYVYNNPVTAVTMKTLSCYRAFVMHLLRLPLWLT